MTGAGLTAASDGSATGVSRLGLMLGLAGGVMLVAAGILLWAQQSETLFAAYLVSAIAGCF